MKNTRSELCLITKIAALSIQQMPPKYYVKIVIPNELHKYLNVLFAWKCYKFKGFQTPFKWRLKAFLYRVCAIFFSHFVLYPDYRISFFIPLAFRFADYKRLELFLVNILNKYIFLVIWFALSEVAFVQIQSFVEV